MLADTLNHTPSLSHNNVNCTCLSVSRAGEWGRRGVECPELGGEGDARVEEVMDEGMKPRPVLSLPREDGGIGGPSEATLLTRLSISSARSSVFSFSSWISLCLRKRRSERRRSERWSKYEMKAD